MLNIKRTETKKFTRKSFILKLELKPKVHTLVFQFWSVTYVAISVKRIITNTESSGCKVGQIDTFQKLPVVVKIQ